MLTKEQKAQNAVAHLPYLKVYQDGSIKMYKEFGGDYVDESGNNAYKCTNHDIQNAVTKIGTN